MKRKEEGKQNETTIPRPQYNIRRNQNRTNHLVSSLLFSIHPLRVAGYRYFQHVALSSSPTGTMEERMGLLFLIVLGAAWACDARELADPDLWSSNTANSELNRQPDLCELCEEYTAEALDYLNDNKTQNEIIGILHNTCYQLPCFKQQCITLVDYYASLFFSEIASIQPGELCKTINLCQYIAKISSQVQENSCGLCKDTVSAILVKLKDPDTELEIMETLLKVCNSMEKLAKKCKRMVFEYGPLVLINAEKFLKTTDICTALHACQASTAVSQEASIMEEIPLLSDS